MDRLQWFLTIMATRTTCVFRIGVPQSVDTGYDNFHSMVYRFPFIAVFSAINAELEDTLSVLVCPLLTSILVFYMLAELSGYIA